MTPNSDARARGLLERLYARLYCNPPDWYYSSDLILEISDYLNAEEMKS